MVKVFTTGENPDNAGDVLTKMIEAWEESLDYGIVIKQVRSNSNKYGWMLVVVYDVIA